MNEAWRGFASAWEDLRAEVHEYREARRGTAFWCSSGSPAGQGKRIDAAQLRIRWLHVMHNP